MVMLDIIRYMKNKKSCVYTTVIKILSEPHVDCLHVIHHIDAKAVKVLEVSPSFVVCLFLFPLC